MNKTSEELMKELLTLMSIDELDNLKEDDKMSVAKIGTYSAAQRASLDKDTATIIAGIKKYGNITKFKEATGFTPKTEGFNSASSVLQTQRALNSENVHIVPTINKKTGTFNTSTINKRSYISAEVRGNSFSRQNPSTKKEMKSQELTKTKQNAMKQSNTSYRRDTLKITKNRQDADVAKATGQKYTTVKSNRVRQERQNVAKRSTRTTRKTKQNKKIRK